MLKAIVISLLFVISTGQLSCKTALCLQENFQKNTASGESSECATVLYNLFVWLVEVFKNNLPFIFTLLCCYVAFIVVPALLFTLYLFSKDETPHRKPLPRRRSNEGLNNNTTNTNIDNNNLDAPQTELNPLFATSPQDSAPTGSQSESCISNKAPAYSGNRPHEEQQRALAQPNEPLAVQQVNERDSQNEESPEISSIESADSVTLLWNLGSEICQEPTLRKNCVIVGSGLLLAIMIYRLARK
ncbi:uncharacterized protein LOC144663072 [Oculina patagonica]